MDFILLPVAVVIGISGLHSSWLFTAVVHELIACFPSQDNSEFRVRLGVCWTGFLKQIPGVMVKEMSCPHGPLDPFCQHRKLRRWCHKPTTTSINTLAPWWCCCCRYPCRPSGFMWQDVQGGIHTLNCQVSSGCTLASHGLFSHSTPPCLVIRCTELQPIPAASNKSCLHKAYHIQVLLTHLVKQVPIQFCRPSVCRDRWPVWGTIVLRTASKNHAWNGQRAIPIYIPPQGQSVTHADPAR